MCGFTRTQGHLYPEIGQPREPPYILCLDREHNCIIFNDDGQPYSTAKGFYEAIGVWATLIKERDCILAPRVACDGLIERMLEMEEEEVEETPLNLGPGQTIA